MKKRLRSPQNTLQSIKNLNFMGVLPQTSLTQSILWGLPNPLGSPGDAVRFTKPVTSVSMSIYMHIA